MCIPYLIIPFNLSVHICEFPWLSKSTYIWGKSKTFVATSIAKICSWAPRLVHVFLCPYESHQNFSFYDVFPWFQTNRRTNEIRSMEATRCVAPEAIILSQKVCFRNKPQTANRPQNLKMFLPNIQGGLQRKLDRYILLN